MLGVVLVLFFGKWHPSESQSRSIFSWTLERYRNDFLPAFFAIRGAFLLFTHRRALVNIPAIPAPQGFAGFLAMLALYSAAGWLEMPALAYLSLVGMLWFLAIAWKGVGIWRRMAGPALCFMLATPDFLQPLTFILRLLTAKGVILAMSILGIPMAEHGFMITSLSGSEWHFTVAEECSGTRTITTLLFVALLFEGGLSRGADKAILLLSAFPLGLAMNILRTLAIGIICDSRGEAAGMAFHHSLLAGAGPLVIGTGMLLLVACYFTKRRTAPSQCRRARSGRG